MKMRIHNLKRDLFNSFANTWKEAKSLFMGNIFFLCLGLLLWSFQNQILGLVLSILFAILTGFLIFFFRDPERIVAADDTAILSPADGKVIGIDPQARFPGHEESCQRLDIFLSVFDVHINRVPVTGQVAQKKAAPGHFYAAFKGKSSELNEHVYMELETKQGKLGVKQIAGFLARRIVNDTIIGKQMQQGQRFGMIKFGSRVELFIPNDVQLVVNKGKRVRAGITVLGWKKNA